MIVTLDLSASTVLAPSLEFEVVLLDLRLSIPLKELLRSPSGLDLQVAPAIIYEYVLYLYIKLVVGICSCEASAAFL